MRKCCNCKRAIGDNESCVRDFDGRYACTTCYGKVITTLPKHGAQNENVDGQARRQ